MQKADITKDNLQLGAKAAKVTWLTGAIGLVAIAAAVIMGLLSPDGGESFATAYLTAFVFFLTLALGALFFVLLQHVTGAGWGVVVRRPAEAIAGVFPLFAVLSIPLLLNLHSLYPWTGAEAAGDHVLAGKAAYLNVPFFLIRWIAYFGIWSLMAAYFRRTSARQDSSGDPALTIKMERLSAPGMVVFALTATFFSFDVLMSRDPHWYSTIYGVYLFSGSVVGFCALLPLLTMSLQRWGRIQHAVTREHYHDLGKLTFAFVVFWAYIAFSQFMLMWYSNIPEETSWYLRRLSGPWSGFSLILLLGHFVIPFWLLISRGVKRRPATLALAASWVLLMHLLDVYWLTMPESSPSSLGFSLMHVLCLVGVGALMIAAVTYNLSRNALIPVRDPRLDESLSFENV
ncbi:MAG: quinol:cytochrome C oxidoreductase [candidate division Zixibacteria bacterium]|nr:quinol:cytochrome C oxidoreductase [candidate division Zixibacteria bacterium]